MQSIEKYCTISQIENAKNKILIAYQASNEHVNQFIQRYLDDNDRPNWEDFKKEITERFGEYFNAEIAFAKIKTIKQLEGENIAVYAERLMTIANNAYETHARRETMDLIQHQLVQFFIEGLRSREIRVTCSRSRVNSFHDIIKIAIREQNIRDRYPTSTLPKTTNSRYYPQYERPTSGPEAMEVDATKGRPRCNYCKKVGHFDRDCRNVHAVTTQTMRRQATQNTIRCYNCNRLGHYAQECRARLN